MQKQLRTPTNPASFKSAGIDITDGPSRAEYERFIADLKVHLAPFSPENHAGPTFEEFSLSIKEHDHG
jgi:hypothetical protein